jgi:hypothetical protein
VQPLENRSSRIELVSRFANDTSGCGCDYGGACFSGPDWRHGLGRGGKFLVSQSAQIAAGGRPRGLCRSRSTSLRPEEERNVGCRCGRWRKRSGSAAGRRAMFPDYPPSRAFAKTTANAVEMISCRDSKPLLHSDLLSDPVASPHAPSPRCAVVGMPACFRSRSYCGNRRLTVTGSAEVTFDGCDVATNSNAR